MCKIDVLGYGLLDVFAILLLLRFGDDMSYELLDTGVNVLLAVARHGRIVAELARENAETACIQATQHNEDATSRSCKPQICRRSVWMGGC